MVICPELDLIPHSLSKVTETGKNVQIPLESMPVPSFTKPHMFIGYKVDACKPLVTVAQQLSRQYRKDVEENRRNVRNISEVAQLFCKQNIPFRGHDESQHSNNRGNYLEILHWIAKDS